MLHSQMMIEELINAKEGEQIYKPDALWLTLIQIPVCSLINPDISFLQHIHLRCHFSIQLLQLCICCPAMALVASAYAAGSIPIIRTRLLSWPESVRAS